jgi:hypothetical protein
VATVGEVDILGSQGDRLTRTPAAMRLIAKRAVDGYEIVRFALTRPWRLSPQQIAARSSHLLTAPAPVTPVLIQAAR